MGGGAGGGRQWPGGLLVNRQWLFWAVDWLRRTNLAQGTREFESPSSKLLKRGAGGGCSGSPHMQLVSEVRVVRALPAPPPPHHTATFLPGSVLCGTMVTHAAVTLGAAF